MSFTLLLLATGVGSWFLAQEQERKKEQQQAPTEGPDYWVEQLDVTEMDDLGRPRHTLKAIKAMHFDDATTRLTKPRLTLYAEAKPPWQVRSDQGWVSADRSLIRLTDNVVVSRAAEGELRPLRGLTSELWVRPREDYAETDRHVRLESYQDWMEGDGMQIWFQGPVHMKLLSRVKARYEVD